MGPVLKEPCAVPGMARWSATSTWQLTGGPDAAGPMASLPPQNCANLPTALRCSRANANLHSPRSSLNLFFLLSVPIQAQGCECQLDAGLPQVGLSSQDAAWVPTFIYGAAM